MPIISTTKDIQLVVQPEAVSTLTLDFIDSSTLLPYDLTGIEATFFVPERQRPFLAWGVLSTTDGTIAVDEARTDRLNLYFSSTNPMYLPWLVCDYTLEIYKDSALFYQLSGVLTVQESTLSPEPEPFKIGVRLS